MPPTQQPTTRKTFIKSSSRIKPDPGYYRRKHAFFWDKLIRLMDQAGRNLDVQPPSEPPELTRAINNAEAKMLYYSRMVPVASAMYDQIRAERGELGVID